MTDRADCRDLVILWSVGLGVLGLLGLQIHKLNFILNFDIGVVDPASSSKSREHLSVCVFF
jgi:hypothetical protein